MSSARERGGDHRRPPVLGGEREEGAPAHGRLRLRRDRAGAVDRFELVNRHEVFGWVADARLPAVATGDFHRPEHLASWKTLLPCAKAEASVVGYLRSPAPAYLVRFEPGAVALAA